MPGVRLGLQKSLQFYLLLEQLSSTFPQQNKYLTE